MNETSEVARLEALIRRETRLTHPPLVPELRCWTAEAFTPLWSATEEALKRSGLAPPFWAFAWAGGQALARALLDAPERVAGRRVYVVAAGAGLEALAAARAGAAAVTVNDLDPAALVAARLNAEANGLTLGYHQGDAFAAPAPAAADLLLAADIFYEGALAERARRWLAAAVAAGAGALIADAGRGRVAPEADPNLEILASYDVPTPTELEDVASRRAVVCRVRAPRS